MLNVMALVNGSLSDALRLRRLLSSVARGVDGGVLPRGHETALRAVPSYVYFALVESGMLLSFGGLAAGERGSLAPPCSRPYDVRVVAAPTMGDGLALGTLISHVKVDTRRRERRKLGNSILRVPTACSLLIRTALVEQGAAPAAPGGRRAAARRLAAAVCFLCGAAVGATSRSRGIATVWKSNVAGISAHGPIMASTPSASPARWRRLGSSPLRNSQHGRSSS